jgi:hypothetical protein
MTTQFKYVLAPLALSVLVGCGEPESNASGTDNTEANNPVTVAPEADTSGTGNFEAKPEKQEQPDLRQLAADARCKIPPIEEERYRSILAEALYSQKEIDDKIEFARERARECGYEYK